MLTLKLSVEGIGLYIIFDRTAAADKETNIKYLRIEKDFAMKSLKKQAMIFPHIKQAVAEPTEAGVEPT